jgi:hypothetical protein
MEENPTARVNVAGPMVSLIGYIAPSTRILGEYLTGHNQLRPDQGRGMKRRKTSRVLPRRTAKAAAKNGLQHQRKEKCQASVEYSTPKSATFNQLTFLNRWTLRN